MLTIDTLPFGSYQTNCYIVREQSCESCVIIDPGYQPETILAHLRKEGLTPEAILLTHGHFDHVGAVRPLAEALGCPVYLCKEDLSLPPVMTDGPLHYTHTYTEGDALALAGLTFRVLQTPGHTPGSVCIVAEDAMFCGDTLFAGSCGRVDFPGSSVADMRRSLARLANLTENYTVYPGHGGPSTLREEQQYNPYLKGLL
ncbi:MAG: MBL fold metallo-hydrolase [Oscillospiraceae bacterium]|nr:MBL fold metallo-hydrolase [Oscillospiraceae bacterium]